MDFKAVLRDLSVALMAGSRPAWATLLLSVVVGASLVCSTHSAPGRLGRRITSALASP